MKGPQAQTRVANVLLHNMLALVIIVLFLVLFSFISILKKLLF